jgi:type II secretory pathway predicted ATPase ExeA
MDETFFGLSQRPFAAAPLAACYVPVESVERSRRTLARCIERAEGAALLIGPTGCGKTLMCQLLADQFRQQFQVVLLASGHFSAPRDLLQGILFELGLPYRGWEEGELRLALIDYLTRSPQCPHGILLIVDEAHTLPLKLVEELRQLTNVVRGGQPRVRLVLVAAPALEERLASPKLESFSQRLAARCYLEPLDRSETYDYVCRQLRLAGGDPRQIMGQDALDAVYKASDGIPRLINQLCDHALLMALQAGHRPVDATTVERAWADLQQLPTPWSETDADRMRQAPTETIEFGGLEEDYSPQPSTPKATDMPTTHFELSVDDHRFTAIDSCVESVSEPIECLSAELEGWGDATEVELQFDEPAIEPSEQFEVNLSLTSLPATPALPSWDSTEFCEPCETADSGDQHPFEVEQYEGEFVSQDKMVEEFVVDRYATLDALKRQGKLPRPQAVPAAAAGKPAREVQVSTAAHVEGSLSLAEALVQHAAALEQSTCVGPAPATALSSEVAHAGVQDTWTSIDSLPPGVDPTVELKSAEPQRRSSEPLPPHMTVFEPAAGVEPFASEEPELIVIEDDPQQMHVQVQPQATPVKRQEYRQLFARLRRS